MRRICALVCGNGLGHIRRTLEVASALPFRSSNLHLNVVCAMWQLDALSRWAILLKLKENPRVTFEFVDIYPRWTMRKEYYKDERLLTWHVNLGPLRLDSYDLVLSDNLVEALVYQPRATLMGSFLWHDIYAAHYPNEPLVQKYWQLCVSLLEKHRPTMIANRYFMMPAVREQTHPFEVGMLPAVIKEASRRDDDKLGILFIGSSVPSIAEQLEEFLSALIAKKSWPDNVRIFVDQTLYNRLPALDLNLFDYDLDDFSRIDAIVARPGMGIITDCIASNIPLFTLSEVNLEMNHNAQTLERLGLGWPLRGLDNCIEQINEFFTDGDTRLKYQQSVSGIDKRGLEQTLSTLMDQMR